MFSMAPCWPFALLHPADHTCLVTDFCLLTPPHSLSSGPSPGIAKFQPLDGMTQDEESPNPHPTLKPHSKGVSTHPCSDPVALRSKGMGASGRAARGDMSGTKTCMGFSLPTAAGKCTILPVKGETHSGCFCLHKGSS